LNPLASDLEHILAHTGDAWETVRGANIFVTGGTGFFGRWLLESFAYANSALKLGARLFVLSRNPERFRERAPYIAALSDIQWVRGDVRRLTATGVRRQLGKYMPKQFTCVIHAATDASAKLNADDPLTMADTIVQGTRAALEFARANGVKRFLLTSSGAVYGSQPRHMTHVHEEYTGAPDATEAAAAYGEAKRMAELLCACFYKQHSIEPIIARCFAFVGPFLPLDAHFAIGNFIRDAVAGGPIEVRGDGTPFRSYLYAADLAIWLWTLLAKGAPCRAYNVGSSDDVTIRETAFAVRDIVCPRGTVEIAQPVREGELPSRYVPAISRAQTELGLRVYVPLADAIRRTATFTMENAAVARRRG
jgi:nucleoside-diphosphate-sugar epimerase